MERHDGHLRPEREASMNTNVEDLLRDGMERCTADLRAPAGLIRRVAQRRRRRLARCSATGATTVLAAGAAALVVVVVPGARQGGIDTTAYVVKQVDSALTAADPGDIAQMTVTTSGPRTLFGAGVGPSAATTTQEWSYGDQWRSVTYSSAGHPVYDEGFSASSVYTLVNYQTRTWTRRSGVGRPAASLSVSGPSGCGLPLAAVPFLFRSGLPGVGSRVSSLPATVARAARAAVSCGTLTVAGRQAIDGVEAIELTSRPGSPFAETIWVSPGTYLPLRVVIRSGPGTPAVQLTADISWLQPTAQNLAKLTVPIPAGFRQVALISAVSPILAQIPAVPLPRALGALGTGSARLKALCPAPARFAATARPSFPTPALSPPATPRVAFSCPRR
jgi:hypothetical protein